MIALIVAFLVGIATGGLLAFAGTAWERRSYKRSFTATVEQLELARRCAVALEQENAMLHAGPTP